MLSRNLSEEHDGETMSDKLIPAPVVPCKTGRRPGTFVPGDKRINRKGRPKSFAQLRERVLAFLAEQDDEASGTRLEEILRELSQKDPKILLEYGFGKVPSAVEVSGDCTGPMIQVVAIDASKI
jgi:hypothetical protein